MSEPNSWAYANVKNDMGGTIFNVIFKHRYDNDHYDSDSYSSIADKTTSENMRVGFWTGAFRTGKDYWYIEFEFEGKVWSCKDNFYCFLTSDDKDKTVTCRPYKDGDHVRMEVICPKSSNCVVELESGIATPNSWANACVKNDWGGTITNLQLNHRYDKDHYDTGSWPTLDNGQSTANMKVGFWTGLFRTGYDYWLVKFEADSKIWTCKDNFYCFLTEEDKDKDVTCRVYKDGEKGMMEVICPKSSNCVVHLESESMNEGARPVYVIAHRCNDGDDIGRAISQGANAVECDLQYDKDTDTLFVNHDHAAGTTLAQWLTNAIAIMNLYPTQFALIVFDCKFATDNAEDTGDIMSSLRDQARDYLTLESQTPINIVFSIASYENRNGFKKIMTSLRPNEGLAIDQSDDPDAVSNYFADNNLSNCWYGDGIFSGGTKDVYEYVRKGCLSRDRNGVLKKVYVWTLAKESSIRKYFKDGPVDAVMVNAPGTVAGDTGLKEALKVIQEDGICKTADRYDDAFKVFKTI